MNELIIDIQKRSLPALWKCVLVVIVLYILQGVTLGIIDVIPLYLVSYGLTWKQQGILSFAMYPFSVKLLWAPLIDVLYIRQLGRRRTWLLPVQLCLGIIFIVLSFHLQSLLIQLRIVTLTIVFFCIVVLIATQDICVDGWALTLFSSSDVIWQSISQMIGQPFGVFLGSSVLLTFESGNMTNRLIREPFGIAIQSYGLFTLAQFVRFWGVMFLITTLSVTILFRKHYQAAELMDESQNRSKLNLLDTYIYVARLFKKRSFLRLLYLIMGPHFGYAAMSAMTYVTLINENVVKREILGLITMPLIIVKVTVPLLVSQTKRPLIVFSYFHMPRLVLSFCIAVFVFFASYLRSYPVLFYVILIFLLALSDALIYFQGSARGAFFACISDKRIGSTYYTLLASLNNLGVFISTSLVLYTANWLPKEHAYYIEVGICLVLGCLWLGTSWKLMYQLQELPVERWHIMRRKQKPSEEYQQHCMEGSDHEKIESIVSAGET
ncbi:unnamed protein product [Adineta ricciae]|uniref:Uncharacterized protein n=1 Tax=Adineta ricciae TaxID=249248 RepID=A0A813TMM1_ADIRI|nr:unnamed protein product [Adineta ricciae]